LIFQNPKKYILKLKNKNHFSCKNKNQLRSFSCSDVSNGGLTLEKEVFQIFLARLEKLFFIEFSGLKSLFFRSLRLEKLKPKVARFGSAQA
jgi:hypothetical protein